MTPALLQAAFDNSGEFSADGIAESNVRDNAVAEKGVDAMARAVEELVWDHKIEGLVFFFQRAHSRNRNDALDSQLLEAVNIGAEIQFAGQQFVPASMAGQKGDLTPFERAQNVCVGGIAKRCLLAQFVRVAESGHVIQTTAPDNANLCLLQLRS